MATKTFQMEVNDKRFQYDEERLAVLIVTVTSGHYSKETGASISDVEIVETGSGSYVPVDRLKERDQKRLEKYLEELRFDPDFQAEAEQDFQQSLIDKAYDRYMDK